MALSPPPCRRMNERRQPIRSARRALFAAFVGHELVALCGLKIDPYADAPRNRAGASPVCPVRIPAARVGEQLVEEIIGAARGWFDRLRLRTGNPKAARLYERMGFRPSADVAHCTHVMDIVGTPEPRNP
jgi:GNAT superfamily N-acetyltransferase